MDKGYKECIYCKSKIKYNAVKCPFCHEFLFGDGTQDEKKEIKEYEKVSNRGPSNRWGKWKFFLFSIIFYGVALSFISFLEAGMDEIFCIAIVINLICQLFFISKRFHDCGSSGWNAMFILLFPPLTLIMYFVEGDEGDNKYGPVPKR